MAATKVNANWSNVSFATTTITRVTACSFDQGGQNSKFKADTDRYATVIANFNNEPKATVTTADVGTAFGFAVGQTGTLTATLKDAKGASGGDVIFTLSNAVVANVNGDGQHGSFASSQVPFDAFSSDGTTNPLAITRA